MKNGHFVKNYVKRVPTQQMSTRATVSSVTGRLFPALKKRERPSGKESLRNKDGVSQYRNKKVAVSLILNENVSETLCILSIDKTNCCRIQ